MVHASSGFTVAMKSFRFKYSTWILDRLAVISSEINK